MVANPKRITFLFLLMASVSINVFADDWPRFRGPGGNGVATDASKIPTAWSPSANLAWKTEMPGPGASSPIIVGGKALITCYSGYGLSQENPGKIENLVRHLVCLDAKSGKKLWQKDVPVTLPEDPYAGIGVTAHGYASHTPVSDGKNVYAFFGKSGVHAFTLDGEPLWSADVGKESDPTKWGSSSSPIVYKNSVIVTASAESQAIVGIDKESGKELWRQEAEGLDGMWGTPTLVKVDDARTDLVMCVAKELWGLNPDNGELRWFADATGAQHAYSSVVIDGKRVYVFAGRGGGSVAVDAGGKGDISKSNTVWTGRDTASFASPVRYENKLFVISRGILTVVDSESGKRLQQLRLKGALQTGSRYGSLDYASPVVVGDHLYYLNGSGQMYVFKIGDELEQVAVNRVTTEKEVFWGSPAISDGNLLIRSAKYLYCVKDQGDEVKPEDTQVADKDDEEDEQPAAGRQSGGRPGGSRQQFDPMAMFGQFDSDSDGKITSAELEGNRMADRLMTLDKDDDDAVSKDEFRNGISSLFRRGGSSGGRSGGGRSGGGYNQKDSRPDRPQRPKSGG
ncbi:MAG: PQQ-binding-like beta-propeller repeat protein [Planctomycetota bacterium]